MKDEKIIPQGPMQYGLRYWCIKVPKTVSKDGEIYLWADDIKITATGDLLAFGAHRKHFGEAAVETFTVLSLAAGKWGVIYAASGFDGSAVAVEHWSGECERKST